MNRPGRIWTVGHSTRTIEELTALLAAHGVEAVADVRRFPGSRRHPHFAGPALAESLAAASVGYLHLPELGGRRPPLPDSPNTAWREESFRGYADYMGTDAFRAGVDRLLDLARARRTAVMCAEAVWWRCHRGLVADYLKSRGWVVTHILGPAQAEPHPYTPAARMENGALTYRAGAGRPAREGGGPEQGTLPLHEGEG